MQAHIRGRVLFFCLVSIGSPGRAAAGELSLFCWPHESAERLLTAVLGAHCRVVQRVYSWAMTMAPETLHESVRAVNGAEEGHKNRQHDGQVVHGTLSPFLGGLGGSLDGDVAGAGEMMFSGFDSRKSALGASGAAVDGAGGGGPIDSPAAPSMPGTEMAESVPMVRIAPAAMLCQDELPCAGAGAVAGTGGAASPDVVDAVCEAPAASPSPVSLAAAEAFCWPLGALF
jgi:hypothetical protein